MNKDTQPKLTAEEIETHIGQLIEDCCMEEGVHVALLKDKICEFIASQQEADQRKAQQQRGRVNESTFRKMVDENIAEITKYMPDSLERRHVIMILNEAAKYHYGPIPYQPVQSAPKELKPLSELEVDRIVINELTGSGLPPEFRRAAMYGAKIIARYFNEGHFSVNQEGNSQPNKEVLRPSAIAFFIRHFGLDATEDLFIPPDATAKEIIDMLADFALLSEGNSQTDDWTKPCECKEKDQHGETWCCNHCGRMTSNHSQTDAAEYSKWKNKNYWYNGHGYVLSSQPELGQVPLTEESVYQLFTQSKTNSK